MEGSRAVDSASIGQTPTVLGMRKLPILVAHMALIATCTALAQGGVGVSTNARGVEAASLDPLVAVERFTESLGEGQVEAPVDQKTPGRGGRIRPGRVLDRVVPPVRPVPRALDIPVDALCPNWWELAATLGWEPGTLADMDVVMYKESRCKPTAFNKTDPNGGSHGLMQINGSWRKWLRDRSVINRTEDLYDPATNLLAALYIYRYGVDRYGFGWGPWGFKYKDPYQGEN